MAKHSYVGASTCYRWWACPGSVNLCRDLPPQKSSVYAEEGTAAHEMATRIFTENLEPEQIIGQFASNGVQFTSEMAEHVATYLLTIDQDLYKAGPLLGWKDLKVEHSFQLKDIDDEAFGTCDAFFGAPFGRLYVYDFKYGAGVPVSAKENKQLLYYAIGAWETGDYADVELVIVQPRVENGISRWVVTAQEMLDFKSALRVAILETREKDAPLHTGAQCKFCPALAVCPEVAKNAQAVAQQDFKTPSPLPVPGALTLPQLKVVLDKADLLSDWLAAIQVHAQSLLESGCKIDGWKLVKKRAHRRWQDEFAVETAFADYGEAIYDKKLKTPKKMEEVVGTDKVAELSEVPDNGFTLAKDEDARTAASSDFTAVEGPKPKTKKTKKDAKNDYTEKNPQSTDTDVSGLFS